MKWYIDHSIMPIGKIKQLTQSEDNLTHIVALDIGTEFVKALVGKVEGDKVKVIGVGRQRQRLTDMYSGAISDIAGVVENCDKALAQAEEMAGVQPKRAVIGIAGELVKGNTTTIKYRRKDPKKELEIDELERIMSKVQDRAYKRAKSQLSWESGNQDIEIRLVNSAIVSITIDGYKVNNPIGFQGKDVSIQLFNAFAPMVHIGAVERVADELDLQLINVAAEPFAVARSVASGRESFSAICIDVGGGTTDIAVVNDGGVEGTKMFGIGGRSFTNSISQASGLDFDRAEQLKLKFAQGSFEHKKEEKIRNTLENDMDVWISGVELALSEFDTVDHLPSKILLCGGGATLPQITEVLKTDEWRKDLPFTKNPDISFIKPTQIQDIVDETDSIDDHTYVTTMGLLNIGLDVINSGDDDESVIDRLNRILQT